MSLCMGVLRGMPTIYLRTPCISKRCSFSAAEVGSKKKKRLTFHRGSPVCKSPHLCLSHQKRRCGKRTGYDDPLGATDLWQYELKQSRCTWKEVCKNEEDDCWVEPEWGTAFIEARLKKLSGEWARRVCGRRRCGGRCDRMYRDPWLWIRIVRARRAAAWRQQSTK